uniref:Uncharacterized protein n=1 Tax=Pyxicephalus adspersus TaxID=30357 RepID=A0AAV2ZM00_PYXAD|nr:TPA: hypothetical protein GDO54_005535 [Pyxicephalus adspersus]
MVAWKRKDSHPLFIYTQVRDSTLNIETERDNHLYIKTPESGRIAICYIDKQERGGIATHYKETQVDTRDSNLLQRQEGQPPILKRWREALLRPATSV